MTDRRKDDGLSEDGRRVAMIVAVALTMVFVVGAWLWLLPSQLGGFSDAGSGDGQADWKSMRDSLGDEATDFRESLDTLSSRMNYTQLSDDQAADAGPPDTATIVERLQEKLDAVESGTAVDEDQK